MRPFRTVQMEMFERRLLLSLTPLGPATDVPGSDAVSSFDAAVAGDGSAIIARVTGDMSAASHSVEVIRYSITGEQVGPIITVASGKDITDVSVSMDADGDAVVAWSNKPLNGTDTVSFEKISSGGVASAPVVVATNVHVGSQPSISMDSTGGFFLAWIEEDTDTSDILLQVQAFDSSGIARAAAFTATSLDHLKGMGDPDIASSPDGSSAVVAADQTFESADDNVTFARVNTNAILGAATDINSALNESSPSVAVNPDGSFEIGYLTYNKVGGSGGDAVDLSILIQRFDANGAAIGNPLDISPASIDANVPKDPLHTPDGTISLDATGDNGFIASWVRTDFSGQAQSATPVMVQRFNEFGVEDASGPISIADQGFEQHIGIDQNGTAVLVFTKNQTAPPLGIEHIATGEMAYVHDGVLFVSGTSDADTITIAPSGANIVVTRGSDSAQFAASTVNVIIADGLGGDDTITNSTALKATLRGGDGNDTIFGGVGVERIIGGAGDDSLWGGDGADRIYGEDGFDSLFGNGGNDRIEGGAQSDHIRGNGGHDHLYGNGGNDHIYGGESGDSIYGQAGNDQLFGEGGNDHLYADDGSGDDTVSGGAGDDFIISRDGFIDHVNGDGGHDTADADSIDVLTSIEATA